MPLTQPQYDISGEVIPHDHPGILPDDWVIRRVAEHHIVPDPKKTNGKRISSMLFNSSSGSNGGMSVDLQSQIEETGQNAAAFVTVPPSIGSIRLNVGALRNINFTVGYDPLPTNPYHGEVWGNFSSTSRRKRVQALSQWLVPIQNVSIS